MITSITVHVPATSANLGPGFDCLALTLDLWNRMEFHLAGEGVSVEVSGEGAERLPRDESNLALKAFYRLFAARESAPPPGVRLRCENRVPLGSGLGSSATAVLGGLMAANAMLGKPCSLEDILLLGTEMEGHPDNIAAAMLGGLVLVAPGSSGVITRRWDVPQTQAVVVTPEIDLPTHQARQALPAKIALKDAVFNVGRTALVVEALRQGDLKLLGQAMDDRLHQRYRLPLIPGAEDALGRARQLGAAAAISGAGPSLIAFTRQDLQLTADAMLSGFSGAGVKARTFLLNVCNRGAF